MANRCPRRLTSRLAPQLSPQLSGASRRVCLGVCLALLAAFSPGAAAQTLPDRAAEHQRYLERLEDDVQRTDKAIEATQELIARSAGRPYLPDLELRLAELYVEKSRYVYFRALESRPEGAAEAIDVPEVRLLKDQAVSIYQKLIRDYPGYSGADRVHFYLAHEYRELGLAQAALAVYGQLIEGYPKSVFALEAHLVLGNHAFRKGDLRKAERHYRAILAVEEGPVHEMARYKLAWIRVNQDRCADALRLLEEIARRGVAEAEAEVKAAAGETATPQTDTVDMKADPHGDAASRDDESQEKLLTVRREALLDSVYCFSETRKPSEALDFYRALARSRGLFVTVAGRLAARYEIKGEFGAAATMLRAAAERTHDPERLVDLVNRLYAAVGRASRFDAVDRDVRLLIRAADAVQGDWKLQADARAQALQTFEVYARDLATRGQIRAQQTGEPALNRAVAAAYDAYLEAFPGAPEAGAMRANRAEALLAAERYVEAGRAWEAVAQELPEGEERRQAMYSGIVSYRRALDTPELHHLDEVQAQEGLKQLGETFLVAYPDASDAPEVQFNVARQFYDQGDWDGAIERFQDFVKRHPQHRDWRAAAHLALDAFFRKGDLEGLAGYGRALLAGGGGDATFKKEIQEIVQGAEARRIARVTVSTGRSRDDRARELVEMAEDGSDEVALEALHTAFQLHRESGNLAQMFAVGRKLVERDTEGVYAGEVHGELAQQALYTGRFVQAAEAWEALQRAIPAQTDGLAMAATIRHALGDWRAEALDRAALLDAGAQEHAAPLVDALARAGMWDELEARADALADPALAALARGRAHVGREDPGAALELWMEALDRGRGDAALRGELGSRTATVLWDDFAALGFGEPPSPDPEDPDAEPVDVGGVIRAKGAMLGELEMVADAAVRSGDPRWTFAGLHRLALASEEMVRFLRSAPIPDGPDAETYRAAIAEKTAVFEEQAEERWTVCNREARKVGVYNAWTLGCARRGAAFLPDHRRPSRPLSGEEARREGALQGELRTRREPKTVAALARLYLGAGDPARARLYVLSALGADERAPELLNVLGAALLQAGEPHEAALVWDEAAAAAPVAQLNLAALRWEFGDTAGATEALGRVRGLERIELRRADIHPSAAAAIAELKGGGE